MLDSFCRITISRFYRDKGLYDVLAGRVIPGLAERVQQSGNRELRIWSAGCGSGEEPYSLSLLWSTLLQQRFPVVSLHILATDIDMALLERAQTACYPYSSLKDLPAGWLESAFSESSGCYCLRPAYKLPVLFAEHDIRESVPATGLQLILCRNLVYTYYDKNLQHQISQGLVAALQPGGALVIGSHEVLPDDVTGFDAIPDCPAIYIKQEYKSL